MTTYMRISIGLLFCVVLLSSTVTGQTVLLSSTVNNGGFESGATGWNVVNGNGAGQTNKWFVGTTSVCSGVQAAFIGTSSTTNTYDNTSTSVVHLYRDIIFPANESQITLTFDLKCQGESVYDFVRVYVVPTTTTPAAGAQVATGQVGNTYYNLVGTCTNYSITLSPTFAGTTQRLVFTWVNDGSLGTNPPATLDNVTLTTQLPQRPSCANMVSPANAASGLCNSGITLNWTAPLTGSAPTGYQLYFGTNNPPSNIVNGTNLGNVLTYNPGTLASNTTYYWQVVPVNSSGTASGCAVWSFTTSSNCFVQTPGGNFTGCSGTFYDPGGAAGNYSNSSSSVTTICPSSPGQYLTATFTSFNTESGFDPLVIYNGNSTTSPIIGTYSGTNTPSCINATSANGCLTFSFSSDGSVVYSGWQATISCTPAPSPCLPSCATMTAPANGSTGVCTNGQLLSWTAPTTGSAPTGYQLYFGTNNPPTNIINGTNIGNVTSYNPGSLLANTVYYWRVVPVNAAGAATGCQNWTFTTGGSCIVQAPGASYTACSGLYYDSGGPTANYGNSENSVTTICPSSPGQFVQLNFTSLNLESCCDFLNIYNGNTTLGTLVGTYSGTQSPCAITSNAANGCLTMQFTSDASVAYSGWTASISCVAATTGPLPGSTCANAPIITLPYNATNHTTSCYGNDYVNTTAGSCGSLYESGEDRVYAFTTAGPQCLSISLTGATTSLIGYQVYTGCPGAGGTCISSNGGATNLNSSVSLPSAGTYYIIIDTWAPPSSANYNLSIAVSGSSPSNDLPCNATTLPLGVNLTGTNACSGNLSEPATPTCWTSGTVNTVWYRVVAPGTGVLRIRTALGSNTNTQIALFSGSCSALTLVAGTGGCNTNAPSCGSSSYQNSELSATGLTAGATYFVAVDGENSITGTFDIVAIDGTQQFPPAAGQECVNPNPVCDTTITIGNPGYQAYGNACDFTGSGICLISGERGSAWYSIPIANSGVLQFNIIPNDWVGAPGTSATDYDFAIWRVNTSITNTCVLINSGAIPVACNYSFLGVTGVFDIGNAPTAYPGFDGAYEPAINVTAGETYILVISNFSNSTSGFTLNFNVTAPINYTSPSTSSVVWTGGTNTQWGLQSNWGGCATPTCGINATVSPSSINQPTLLTGTIYNVGDLTINPGSTLTMQAGSTLRICGNYTNAGSLVANPGATIEFVGTGTQTINGALVGLDKFPNLVVTKATGTVILNNDIEIGGSFTTSNATSIFNSNSRFVKVAGNFTNSAGDITYANPSILEFNGTALQNYNQGSSQLNHRTIIMNHTGPGVNLLSNLCMRDTTGQLNLNVGRIITNTFEVRQLNRAVTSVTTGNVNSFVQGNLRRKLVTNNSNLSYDFPVGHATKGYQRANINFNFNLIDNIVAWFTPYTTLPAGLMVRECNRYYNFNALDNGMWTINSCDASFNRVYVGGLTTYRMTLYNLNYTNAGSCNAWTIMKDSIGAGSWYLNGICDTTSVPGTVKRSSMVGFSNFGTAQGGITLPVELIRFEGRNDGEQNVLQWTTASELNNDFFTLMRSIDGESFEPIGRIAGAGTSTSTHYYEFIDKQPRSGINYYKLRQTDFDGTEFYSDVVAVKVKSKDFTIVSVRPNPNQGKFFLDFYSDLSGEGVLVVHELTGRELIRVPVNFSNGINTLPIDLNGLSKGIYSIRVASDSDGRISPPQLVILQH